MTAFPSRRAVAKQQTRRSIRLAAMPLFVAQGFDNVTTTEVARAAGVSSATLFNHFATKEDLFFGQVETLERAVADLVASCPPGQSLLAALRDHVLYELTAGRAQSDPGAVAPFHQQITISPRLQARESEILARREAVLASALREALDPSADPGVAGIAAGLYVAAQRMVAADLRERLTRMPAEQALREVEGRIDAVFASLRSGLGDLPSRARVTERSSVPAAASVLLDLTGDLQLEESQPEIYDRPIGVRLLTRDPDSGAEHYLIRYPAGLVARRHRHTAAHTIVVLAGALLADGIELGPGGYCHFPAGTVMHHAPAPGRECLFVTVFDGPFDVERVDR